MIIPLPNVVLAGVEADSVQGGDELGGLEAKLLP